MDNVIDHLVEREFMSAHLGARIATVLGWLRRRPSTLIPLDEVRTRLLFHGQHDRGMQSVPLDRIAGSEGRVHEFDRPFRPRREALRRLHASTAFPGRTETALYVAIVEHRWRLVQH